jgi:hypothetical protein
MNLKLPLFALALAALAAACTTTINADFRGRGPVPASADEINQCKDACASQKKAGCMSDDALAQCNAACDGATSDGVAQYRDCVSKDSCNGGCAGGLGGGADAGSTTDAAPKPQDAQPGADAHDAAADTTPPPNPEVTACVAACDSVAACFGTSTAKDDCHARCASATSQARQSFTACTSDTIPPQGCDAFCSDCTASLGGHC